MAIFLPPHVRRADIEQATVKVSYNPYSTVYGKGSHHLVINVKLRNGKQSLLELTGKELEIFYDEVKKVMDKVNG